MMIVRSSMVRGLLMAGLFLAAMGTRAQTPKELIQTVIDNENAAASRHELWEYMSNERSSRTDGHLWTERVVETVPGRVRMLLAVDGKPLTGQSLEQERERIAAIGRHPDEFAKHERNTRLEEKRAREIMEVLQKDFVFENVVLQNGVWTMDFRPDPNYVPGGIEERILHAMAGKLAIDATDKRLIHMDFHVVQEVSIGFGLLADVHTGTNFESDRGEIDGHWHTLHVATRVRAKAILFKTIDLNMEVARSEFRPLDHEVSVPEAVGMLVGKQGVGSRQ